MTDSSSRPGALSHALLRDLRTRTASYCRTEVDGDWALQLPFEQGVRVHFVARGACWLRPDGQEPVQLRDGDVGLLPHGVRHVIAARRDGAARSIFEQGLTQDSFQTFRLTLGDRGAGSLIQCCTLGYADPLTDLLIAAMPARCIVRRGEGGDEVAVVLGLLAAELARDRPGSTAIAARLADAAVALILRDWADAGADRPGWLRPDLHPGLAAALAALHGQPRRRWTLVELALLAGMSRSRFVERFAAAVGRPPGQYVQSLRISDATRMLQDGGLSIGETAAALGYSDATAFSRAYSKATGQTPARAARRERAARRRPP